jgi:hypothetical protein
MGTSTLYLVYALFGVVYGEGVLTLAENELAKEIRQESSTNCALKNKKRGG